MWIVDNDVPFIDLVILCQLILDNSYMMGFAFGNVPTANVNKKHLHIFYLSSRFIDWFKKFWTVRFFD